MEDLSWKDKLISFVKKYRYVIAVCLLGILLMMIPESGKTQETVHTPVQEEEETLNTAQMLSQLLKKVYGAGDVEVMLTVAAGEQTVYQTDSRGSAAADPGSAQIETVIVTSSDKHQTGLVRQVLPEIYLGAIVLCQGADDPSVRLAIIEAVSDATGLSTDKISVLKMK